MTECRAERRGAIYFSALARQHQKIPSFFTFWRFYLEDGFLSSKDVGLLVWSASSPPCCSSGLRASGELTCSPLRPLLLNPSCCNRADASGMPAARNMADFVVVDKAGAVKQNLIDQGWKSHPFRNGRTDRVLRCSFRNKISIDSNNHDCNANASISLETKSTATSWKSTSVSVRTMCLWLTWLLDERSWFVLLRVGGFLVLPGVGLQNENTFESRESIRSSRRWRENKQCPLSSHGKGAVIQHTHMATRKSIEHS